MLVINLLLLLVRLVDGLLRKDVLFELNYENMLCDKYRNSNVSLKIRFGFKHGKSEYFIANMFIIKRVYHDKTLNELDRILIARHNELTRKFYKQLNSFNSVLIFSDALQPVNLSSIVVETIFLGKNEAELAKLVEDRPLGKQVKYRIFLYLNTKSNEEPAVIDRYAQIEMGTTIRKFDIDTMAFVNVQNNWPNLTLAVDGVLNEIYSNGDRKIQKLIEFSNRYAFAREAILPDRDPEIAEKSRLTYLNFLNCFSPLCSGGRVRGLISLSSENASHLFLFVEDRYLEINRSDLILHPSKGKIDK